MDLLWTEKLISLYVGCRRIGKNKYVKTWISPKVFSGSFNILENYPATALADPGGEGGYQYRPNIFLYGFCLYITSQAKIMNYIKFYSLW